jgi:GAF domain-containing protein
VTGKVEETIAAVKEIVSKGGDKDTIYKDVCDLLRKNFSHYNWTGIYVVDGDHLVLRAYAGDAETEHVRIKIGDGICGLAAETGKTVVVPDVSKNFKYIMCFASTKSEIVVPIKWQDNVYGEIDIDSEEIDAFQKNDEMLLEEIADVLGTLFK